ncbi:MAG: response regulator [Eubacteriales bacterium]|nr:response regulator [Eubacteriales bacterium]
MSDHHVVEETSAMPSFVEQIVQFEQMLLEQTAALFAARGERFGAVLQDTLHRVGLYLGVDRGYVFRFNDQAQTMSNVYEWCADGLEPSIYRLQNLSVDAYPAMLSHLRNHEEILIEDVSALPPELEAEKIMLEKQSVCSALILPLKSEQRILGFIGFDAIRRGAIWNQESRGILKFLASTVAVSWQNETNRLDLLQAMAVAKQMAEKAEFASQEKSSFLSNMSHEIRTPMNAVIGVAHLLKNADLSQAQNRYVDIIQTSSQNILQIINSILDLSKIESGKFELNLLPFSLEEVLENLNRMFQFPVEEKGLQISYEHDPRIPAFLVGDPTRLHQILTNLVSNAVKYSNTGHIFVKVQLKDIHDELFWLNFSVADQGVGLSEDELKHLFDPFWQSSVATLKTHHGSGLGLAIVKNLSDLMGGQVDVTSQVAHGSQFTVSLPFTLAKQAAEFKPDLPLSSHDHVLILDDDLSSQRYLARLLHAWSIKSTSCTTINAAVALLNKTISQSHPFTIGIIGQQHLVGDGLDRLSQLRKRTPSIHHLFVLVEPDSSLLYEQNRWSGVINGFLTKPIKASVLSDELMIHLGIDTLPTPPITENNPHYRFQQVSLLIVEDIAINREIIRTLLKTYGIEAEVARDGAMALEMASQTKYDLILMDVQMPFMDGLEATRRIRKLADPQKSRVPIIALTAHALKEDRDACTTAGMNDHLIKPIDPELLYERIAKWLPHRLSPEQLTTSFKRHSQARSSDSQSNETMNGYDQQLFNPNTGLDLVGGNVDIFRSLLRNFIAIYSDLPNQIDRLLTENNQSGLSRICHNLKSTTGHAGSAILSTQAHQLNQIVKTGAWPPSQETKQQLEQFGRDIIHLLNVISHYLETVDQVEAAPVMSESTLQDECMQAVYRLRQLLQDHDPLASRDIVQFILNSACSHAVADLMQRISRNLNLYQFEQASLVLEQLVHNFLPPEKPKARS